MIGPRMEVCSLDGLADCQLHGQLGATTQTTSLDHVATPWGAHARTKTVSLETFPNLGLPCPLWHLITSFLMFPCTRQRSMERANISPR